MFLLQFVLIATLNSVFALNCKCGVENFSTRIGGGVPVPQNRYPWLVIVRSRVRNGKYLNCGGSIINNRFILTAAHCLQNKLNVVSVKITVGTNEKHKSNDFVYAEKWIIHEKYRPYQIMNDIGIVQLRKPLEFNAKVHPICLPEKGDIAKGKFTVAGWGLTETGNSSDILMETSIDEYDFNKCAESWRNKKPLNPKLQICASSFNSSSCSGDSGGPLMQRTNGRMFTAGITSFGNKTTTCGMSVNTVYTRVEPYLNWVLDKTSAGEFCSK